jgi:hypothetical protein
MKKLSRLILLFGAMMAMPLYAAEIDHSTMHHEHEQPARGVKQQAQDHAMQHDQHGASQKDHADHQPMANDQHHNHEAMRSDVQAGSSSGSAAVLDLPRLNALPPSGKSREANFDNTYFMHNTALEQPLEVKCALATRGLIMLDNRTFQKCGGKPAGWSKGITAAQTPNDHSQHMNH